MSEQALPAGVKTAGIRRHSGELRALAARWGIYVFLVLFIVVSGIVADALLDRHGKLRCAVRIRSDGAGRRDQKCENCRRYLEHNLPRHRHCTVLSQTMTQGGMTLKR